MKKSVPGFTILELIVVIAGLGILSSLAISNVTKYIKYTREDQASSLMNSVAADCLQKLRRDGNANARVEPTIISSEKLETFGYEFNQSGNTGALPNCKEVSIGPTSTSSVSPIIGFSINDNLDDEKGEYGKLTKFAIDKGDSNANARWAGNNIQTNEEVNKWRELSDAISAAKQSCTDQFDKWIDADNSGFKDTWNDQRTSGCSSSPPATPDPQTCTAQGCDKRVWALDGEICGYTAEAYDECIAREKGARCQAALKQIRDDGITTQTIDGDPVNDCDGDRYWFFEGEDTGSKDAWRGQMCTANKAQLLNTTHSGPVEHCDISPIYICGGEEILGGRDIAKAKFETCLANDKNALCTTALNEAAVKQQNGGPNTSPTPSGMTAPIGDDCNMQYWYCSESGKIHRSQAEYDADTSCQRRCNHNVPSYCDMPGLYYADECRAYNSCMGRI